MGGTSSKEHPLDREVRAKVVIRSWKKEDLVIQMEDSPDDPMTLVEYAIYLARVERNYEEAERHFERALSMDKSHPNVSGSYALYLEAERKDIEKAGEYYEIAYKSVSLRPTLSELDADMLCNYALYCINVKNNSKKAEELYRRVLVSHPNHTVANGNYGILLSKNQDNIDKAEEKLLKAVDSAPENPHWYLVLGRFYAKTKKNTKLSKEYTKKGKDLQKAQAQRQKAAS